MIWPIGMPNLGHTMEEGLVQEWLKKTGDPVRSGEVIAIVESDKASFDIESPADGVLLAIDVPGGQKALVGHRIGVVGQAGDAVPPVLDQTGEDPPPTATAATSAPASGPASRTRAKASPAARTLAEELGLALEDIQGSGDEGLITRDDVRAHARQLEGKSATTAAGRRQPLSPMRRAIATATQSAWNTIPHVALHSHACIDAWPTDLPLTAAVVRAAALALPEFPSLNGWLHADGFEAAQGANVGLAVATDEGLLTVVVRDAHQKSTQAIDEDIRALAGQARAGTLDGAQLLGASFTVSSLGRWGVDQFAPIISAPQVAILGVGRASPVARPGPGGELRFVKELPLTLVFDHRANDGVTAAQLLAAIAQHLEQPAGLSAA